MFIKTAGFAYVYNKLISTQMSYVKLNKWAWEKRKLQMAVYLSHSCQLMSIHNLAV
jgi:hypothetical protein